jgi:hypothetical protein
MPSSSFDQLPPPGGISEEAFGVRSSEQHTEADPLASHAGRPIRPRTSRHHDEE